MELRLKSKTVGGGKERERVSATPCGGRSIVSVTHRKPAYWSNWLADSCMGVNVMALTTKGTKKWRWCSACVHCTIVWPLIILRRELSLSTRRDHGSRICWRGYMLMGRWGRRVTSRRPPKTV